ncbi:MAG: hypothetical protein ACNS61_03435 [Candidatus Wenzhouxiangella sp. M2_3B_020]
MRASVAILGAITFLFVGLTAISQSAQEAKPGLNSTSANESYQLGVDVFTGVGQGGASALVYGGIGAIVLIALGLLVVVMQGGGR